MVDQMPEPLVATPGSTVDSGGPAKPPATKDKTCPFCNAPFTSSSLGRHLDLYIKDKNPKPPDDVHNVDEIRRLRGNVTRRQARTSSGKREGSTPSSAKPTPMREQRSPSASVPYTNAGHANGGPVKVSLNQANWQATGVINDLPPPTRESPSSYHNRKDMMRRISVKANMSRKQDTQEERDQARAAELALQEVLGSVKAACSRVQYISPFDFNWFNQSFPALCLRCLSIPLCLLSSPSNPSVATWSLDPPGPDQFHDLEAWLESRLSKWQRERNPLVAGRQHELNGINGHAASNTPFQDSKDTVAYSKHLSCMYQAWKSLSEIQKQENWRLECQRAFTWEREKHRETEAKLDHAQQEVQHLRAQLEQQSDHQRLTEFSHFPPATMPLSREALRALGDHHNLSEWSYEATILKWKARIQYERNFQRPLPNLMATTWPASMEAGPLTNGTPYPQLHSHHRRMLDHNAYDAEHDLSEDDEDLADAPGDDDEDEELTTSNRIASEAIMDRRMLDPHLRDRLDMATKSAKGIVRNGDGDGYSGGRDSMGRR